MSNKEAKQNNQKKWGVWVIAILIVCVIGGIGLAGKKDDTANQTSAPDQSAPATNKTNTDKTHTTGENFDFDGLVLNLSDNYSFATISNQFSDLNGKTAISIPITVTNNSSESKGLNMYSYKGYGANGVELEKPSAFFTTDAVDFAGDLQPGASYTKNLYFVYDGDGKYVIEFGYIGVDASVSLDVTK